MGSHILFSMLSNQAPKAKKISTALVNKQIDLRNRLVGVAPFVGVENGRLGNEGTIVSMASGAVETRKSARGVPLAKAGDINVQEILFDGGKRYHPQESGYDAMLCAFAEHLGHPWGKGSV
jgi:hypothetical protein